MKKTIIYSLAFAAIAFAFSSCSLFELDNYDEPSETIKGTITDVATGDPVYTDQGSEGIRIRLTELSYGDNVEHNPDFYCKMDGTYQNTKIFKGTYNVRIDGPFIPLVRETSDGVVISDETVTTDIEGTTVVNFQVQPFLKVEIVGIPQISDGKITAKVRVTRAVSVEDFRSKIEPMGDYDETYTNVTDIQLFVSYSSTVGYSTRDERWSNMIEYSGSSFESLLGQEVEITSAGTIPSNRKVFIRAAARINYATPIESGTRRWNYSAPMEVNVP
jgi:hypothetical protein